MRQIKLYSYHKAELLVCIKLLHLVRFGSLDSVEYPGLDSCFIQCHILEKTSFLKKKKKLLLSDENIVRHNMC